MKFRCRYAAGFCASAYVAPKAGVLSLANALRLEVRPFNLALSEGIILQQLLHDSVLLVLLSHD